MRDWLEEHKFVVAGIEIFDAPARDEAALFEQALRWHIRSVRRHIQLALSAAALKLTKERGRSAIATARRANDQEGDKALVEEGVVQDGEPKDFVAIESDDALAVAQSEINETRALWVGPRKRINKSNARAVGGRCDAKRECRSVWHGA